MRKLLWVILPFFVLAFFYTPQVFAGTCDYPSTCDTYWGQIHDNAPEVGQDCNIPGVTKDGQYKYGTSNVCWGGKAPCVPKCGFFGRGYCCDPKGNSYVSKVTPSPVPPPCAASGKDGSCASVKTAIGPLSTAVGDLANQIFRILLSLSGGIAVLLIIASGYQMAISQGNPEKVKEARERLTSAIVGLLFIIFSVTILQIIGVDILNLPGFGK